ncbi:unnamed protein product [Schistosoma spindalis]|nr:unnamed protein product [Schistosoma spindale]
MLVRPSVYKQLQQNEEGESKRRGAPPSLQQQYFNASQLDYYYYTYLLNNHPDEISKLPGDVNISIDKYSSPLFISQFRKIAKSKLSHINRCCILNTNRPASIPEEEEEEELREEEEEECLEEDDESEKDYLHNKEKETLMHVEDGVGSLKQCLHYNENNNFIVEKCQKLVDNYADNNLIKELERNEGLYENYQLKRSSFRHNIISCIKDTTRRCNNQWNITSCGGDVDADICGRGIYWPEEYDRISFHGNVNSYHHGDYCSNYDENNNSGSNESIFIKSEPLFCTSESRTKSIYINKYKKKMKNRRRNSVSFDLSSTSLSDDCNLVTVSQSNDSDQHWFGSGRNLWLPNTNRNNHCIDNDNNSSSINNNVFFTDSNCTTTSGEILDSLTLCSSCNSSCNYDSGNNNYSDHHPNYHCTNNNDNVDSRKTLITNVTASPILLHHHSINTKSESVQCKDGNSHSVSPLSSINNYSNNGETNAVSNAISIQSKNNSTSLSNVCFASSPRGNTVITHHPASPFARVPRGVVGKNEVNVKIPIQSKSSVSMSNVCITATVTTHTTTCIDNFSTNQNIPVTSISTTDGSSCVSTELQSDSSDYSLQKQSSHVNGNQQPNSISSESDQLINLSKTNSADLQNSMNNKVNNSHGFGRRRSNVPNSYPTYEEAWDLKLARQLGVGVSRLPSIIPLSSNVQNYIPQLPFSIPSNTSTNNHDLNIPISPVSVYNKNKIRNNNSNFSPFQPLSLDNNSNNNRQCSTDDSHSIESNFKLLNISTSTSSSSSSASSCSNDKVINSTSNSELISVMTTTNHVDESNRADHVVDTRPVHLNKLDRKSTNGSFRHDELISNNSSHMVLSGKTENNGEYDYAYNGSWSMGVKLSLDLAINNSSNDTSLLPNIPKYINATTTPTAAMIKTVKSSLNHPTPSSHHQHHPNYHHQLIQHGLSSSGQLQESSKFISIKNTNGNDLKLNLTTRPVQSVLSNDLDSISTSSCDESWDAQHGRLVSKLMSGRFVDPSTIISTTGKSGNATTTTTMEVNNDFLTSETCNSSATNILTVPNLSSTFSSCTSSSPSLSSSSSSVSMTSHVVITSVAPPSHCTSSMIPSSNVNLHHSMNSVSKNKLLSSQNNLPKGLPPHLETLSLEEQPWFHPSLTRSEAEELIRNEPEGSFLVRPSETCPNDFSLTIKHKSFLHMKITRNSTGQFILGEYSQPYASVSQMIYHYARTLVPVLGAYSVTLTHPVCKRI